MLVDEAELEVLVQRLRDGDDSVAEPIILHFLGLARSLSRHAILRHPEKTEDIRAVAVLGVVQAVRWARERMYNNNIGPYITSTVRRFIQEFLEHDHMIRIPRDEWRTMVAALKLDELDDYDRVKALKELKRLNMIFQGSLEYLHDSEEFAEDFILGKNAPSILHYDSDYSTVKAMHHYLKMSYNERQILQMRIEGYTLHEIGASLRRSHEAIRKVLTELQERYRMIQRNHPILPEPPR